MKQIIFIVFLIVISVDCIAECKPKVSLDEEWEDTHVIFIGKVISDSNQSSIYDVYGNKLEYVTVRISKKFKWDNSEAYSDTTTFFQFNIECFKFQKDVEYLIFANSFENTFYYASVCSRTCPLSKAKDIIPLLEKKINIEKRDYLKEEIIELKKSSK